MLIHTLNVFKHIFNLWNILGVVNNHIENLIFITKAGNLTPYKTSKNAFMPIKFEVMHQNNVLVI